VIASDHADIPFSLSDHTYMFKEGDAPSIREFYETIYLGSRRG
jgi:hypothetical protein